MPIFIKNHNNGGRKLERKIPDIYHKVFIAVFCAVLLICTALTAFFILHNDGQIAEIRKDGELLYTIDLRAVTRPYEIPVKSENGFNTILVENGKISVNDASCPDKLCIKQGSITNGSYPIVCLPNKLVITIKYSHNTNDIDIMSK